MQKIRQVSQETDGFLTVKKWWEVFEPEALALLEDAAASLDEEEHALAEALRERGVAAPTVTIEGRKAYPLWALSEFYSLNP